MKLTIVALLTFVSTLVFAGQENEGIGKVSEYDAAAIYKALNVKEIAMNPGFAGAVRRVKSVGGLTCQKASLITGPSNFSYDCSIDQQKENFKAIYIALKIKAIAANPGIAGASRFVKTVGGLTCQVATIVYPSAKPTYSCSMIE